MNLTFLVIRILLWNNKNGLIRFKDQLYLAYPYKDSFNNMQIQNP